MRGYDQWKTRSDRDDDDNDDEPEPELEPGDTDMTTWELNKRVCETAERCVIKRNGEVHAYGKMPNTNQTGWYLYGYRDELVREFAREALKQASV